MFHYTISVNVNIEQAIEKVEESLKAEGFGVLWKFNIKEKLHEKGLDFTKDFRVLEVCNPHEAKHVLEKDSMVGYFLPCKIVVYEENDQVYIGMPKPTALIGILENKNITTIAEDIEKRLIHCIDQVNK